MMDRRRVRVGLAAVTAGLAVLLSACGGDGLPKVATPAGTQGPDVARAQPAVTSTVSVPALSVSPANGTVGLTAEVPVRLSVAIGTLTGVTVTSESGAALPGGLSPDQRTWTSSGRLALATRYLTRAEVRGDGDARSVYASSFTTLTPARRATVTASPDGTTVGVGTPISVSFSQPVTDRAAAEQHLSVQASPAQEGAWRWFSSTNVRWRPKTYWQPGTRVTVTSDLSGMDLGNGTYASDKASGTYGFSVGDAHVSTVDLVAHTMTVTSNGQVLRTFPISGGDSDHPTINGVHTVQYKKQLEIMDSSTVKGGAQKGQPGYYRLEVPWATKISTSGEYVHAAPWSVADQGRNNVSHGCINAAPDNAQWFYNLSRPGDVVTVTGSDRAPSASTGTAEWNISWATWTNS